MGQRRMRLVQIALSATLLLAGALLVHPSVKAQPTYVSGEISGIWDDTGSPYIVVEDAVVHGELTIKPGVTVSFEPATTLLVHGSIFAKGGEGDERVVFTSNASVKAPGDWHGIILSVNSTGNLFDFTKIEYATQGIRCTEESAVTIKNTEIANSSSFGLNLFTSFASIVDSKISGNNAGIWADNSEIEVIRSEISQHPDFGLAFSYSNAVVESTEIMNNHNGIMAIGSEVHLFDSNIHSTLSTIWLSDVSFVTTLDTFFSIGSVVFDGLPSTLIVQWTLKIRVVDIHSTGIPGATVTVEGTHTDTMTFDSGEEGWIETLIVRELVKTNTEEVLYIPYFVNATRSDSENGLEVFVTEPKVVTVKLSGDFTDPVANAGEDFSVNEGKTVVFDASGSTDDDPDFLATGTFVWTFYDHDGHEMEAGLTVSHVFETPGTYTVKLRAEDSFGNWDDDFLKVTVKDITNPKASFSMPEETKIRTTVVLDASASTDNDPEFPDTGNFTWIIGDGDRDVMLYGITVEYEFQREGTHTVQLEVRDSAGNMGLDLADVKVLKEPEEFPYLPLIVAAFVGMAFAGIANTEAGKYWFLKFLILPLYVKLSKKDVLDHFIRGQIYGYLVVHPGDNYTTIKQNLNLTNGTLTYHLDVLEREGYVKSQLRGTRRYYYPKEAKMPDNGTGFPAIKDDIIVRIEETPGITVSDLASLIGVSRQLTNYHLRALIQEGYVRMERKGVRFRCYSVEKGPSS